MSNQFDYLIVGAGLFGSVFAAEMHKVGKSVNVIEKRNHIGGNCFTKNMKGICVHAFGPHIFHTDNEKLWNYVNQFTRFEPFINRPKVYYKGKLFSFPINLMTLNQLWGVRTPCEARIKLEEVSISYEWEPENFEEWLLSKIGYELYDIFYKNYTEKLWRVNPRELPADFAKRVPIRFTFNDNYYDDQYQGVPIEGYTRMFDKMLAGIRVELNVDYLTNVERFRSMAKTIVYTGRLDEYFNCEFGKLNYRNLYFVNETLDCEDFQGTAVVNYPEKSFSFIRITEHKHFYGSESFGTVITKEIPTNTNGVPCYPVRDKMNVDLLKEYEKKASQEKNVLFGGRLATFQYLNMDEVISNALTMVSNCLLKGVANV